MGLTLIASFFSCGIKKSLGIFFLGSKSFYSHSSLALLLFLCCVHFAVFIFSGFSLMAR
jgi:hypothetical protein